MIQTRLITNPKDIDELLPKCNALASQSGSWLAFNQIVVPLLWWKHFGGDKTLDFGQRRGRNFFGVQSWVEEFHLVVAEDGQSICGVAPLVSTLVKIAGEEHKKRILSFAGDSVLIAYQDLLVSPLNREAIVSLLLEATRRLIKRRVDSRCFLTFLQEASDNY